MRVFAACCPACREVAARPATRCDAPGLPRRGMLAGALALAAAPFAPAAATPAAVAEVLGSGPRRIAIRRVQTGESLSGIYWRDGRYDRELLRQLDWLMRDPSLGEATPMDPRLFDVMATVQKVLGSEEAWHVISGYRAPETNALRARQSRRVSRVSLHMSGMAADVMLPGQSSLGIARIAAELQLGGVGLYRRDGFIHLDCGPARRW
ncbi:MAG: DUF882 domain-containing protein [Rhodovarius sp.]|nr:DUF882 domain-containing protein [Rhodovarius sp.]MDW8315709.1 DUF882 domain-containing protein [Rhodovarius sp.]